MIDIAAERFLHITSAEILVDHSAEAVLLTLDGTLGGGGTVTHASDDRDRQARPRSLADSSRRLMFRFGLAAAMPAFCQHGFFDASGAGLRRTVVGQRHGSRCAPRRKAGRSSRARLVARWIPPPDAISVTGFDPPMSLDAPTVRNLLNPRSASSVFESSGSGSLRACMQSSPDMTEVRGRSIQTPDLALAREQRRSK